MADRSLAPEDRARAAADQARDARERAGLEAELQSADLVELTGACQRALRSEAIAQRTRNARRAWETRMLRPRR